MGLLKQQVQQWMIDHPCIQHDVQALFIDHACDVCRGDGCVLDQNPIYTIIRPCVDRKAKSYLGAEGQHLLLFQYGMHEADQYEQHLQ